MDYENRKIMLLFTKNKKTVFFFINIYIIKKNKNYEIH